MLNETLKKMAADFAEQIDPYDQSGSLRLLPAVNAASKRDNEIE